MTFDLKTSFNLEDCANPPGLRSKYGDRVEVIAMLASLCGCTSITDDGEVTDAGATDWREFYVRAYALERMFGGMFVDGGEVATMQPTDAAAFVGMTVETEALDAETFAKRLISRLATEAQYNLDMDPQKAGTAFG